MSFSWPSESAREPAIIAMAMVATMPISLARLSTDVRLSRVKLPARPVVRA